jgi:hypothetical protein
MCEVGSRLTRVEAMESNKNRDGSNIHYAFGDGTVIDYRYSDLHWPRQQGSARMI